MKNINKFTLERTEYSWNNSSGKVTFTGEEEIALENIALITNITNNIIIYNPHCDGVGGTLTNKVLTLEKPSGVSNEDDLLIFIQKNVTLVGVNEDETRIQDAHSHLLKEILIQMNINNEYLHLLIGDRVNSDAVEPLAIKILSICKLVSDVFFIRSTVSFASMFIRSVDQTYACPSSDACSISGSVIALTSIRFPLSTLALLPEPFPSSICMI